METEEHDFSTLFDQLGLPSDESSIRAFCAGHYLEEGIALPDATFWTPQQAQFLREGWQQDADWAIVIDQLNVSLKKRPAQAAANG